MPIAQPVDPSPIAYAGLRQEHESADEELRKQLQAALVTLSTDRLGGAALYVGLFDAFTVYAQTLLHAYAKQLEGGPEYIPLLLKFRSAIFEHIAPRPSSPKARYTDRYGLLEDDPATKLVVPDTGDPHLLRTVVYGDPSGAFDVEDEREDISGLTLLRADSFWEMTVSSVVEKVKVRTVLGEERATSLIYAMRSESARQDLSDYFDEELHEPERPAPRKKAKKGRPPKLPVERKLAALVAKARNQPNRAQAKILYDVSYPTSKQTKNVTTNLRYFVVTQPSLVLEHCRQHQDLARYLQAHPWSALLRPHAKG